MKTNMETALSGKISGVEARQCTDSPALALPEPDVFHATDGAGVRYASMHEEVAILGYN